MIPKENFIFMDSPMAAMREYGKYGISTQNAFYGQHDIDGVMQNLFMNELFPGTCEETNKTSAEIYYEIAKHVGWFWLSDDMAIITKKPTKYHTYETINSETGNVIQILHNFNGPAIEYADGERVYAINGVSIKKEYEWIVKTPKDEMKAEDILKISDIKVRNEAIKKFQN
jgi:hypothetical protein